MKIKKIFFFFFFFWGGGGVGGVRVDVNGEEVNIFFLGGGGGRVRGGGRVGEVIYSSSPIS